MKDDAGLRKTIIEGLKKRGMFVCVFSCPAICDRGLLLDFYKDVKLLVKIFLRGKEFLITLVRFKKGESFVAVVNILELG